MLLALSSKNKCITECVLKHIIIKMHKMGMKIIAFSLCMICWKIPVNGKRNVRLHNLQNEPTNMVNSYTVDNINFVRYPTFDKFGILYSDIASQMKVINKSYPHITRYLFESGDCL